jgi:hypothetical protein
MPVTTDGLGFVRGLRVWGDFTGDDSGVLCTARIKLKLKLYNNTL